MKNKKLLEIYFDELANPKPDFPNWPSFDTYINIKLCNDIPYHLKGLLAVSLLFLLAVTGLIIGINPSLNQYFNFTQLPFLCIFSGICLLAYFFTFKKYGSFQLSFVECGIQLPKFPMPLSNTSSLHIAIRPTAPKFNPQLFDNLSSEQIVAWLLKPEQALIKHKILLVGMNCLLKNAEKNFWGKIKTSMIISRFHIILLFWLFFITGIVNFYYEHYICTAFPNSLKIAFAFLSLVWLVSAIRGYNKQIYALSQFLEEKYQYDYHNTMPVFYWNPSNDNWAEVERKQIYDWMNFFEAYGLNTTTFAQISTTILTTFYLISLQLL